MKIVMKFLWLVYLVHWEIPMAFDEAYKALAYAYEEYKRFEEGRDLLLLRDACEKAWLAIILATDQLLVSKGVGKPSSYRERREMLRRLVAGRPELEGLGIDDRFYARAYKLNILGLHEGAIDPEDVEEELRKAEEYLKTLESLTG